MQHAPTSLDTPDGARLHVNVWLPDGRVRGIVQLVHGLAEHSGRYEPVAGRLTAAGYAVYADDHRGHGLTAVDAEDRGFFADEGGWELVLQDQRQVAATARAAHPGVPLVLVGHSLGSFLSQHFASRYGHELDGLALSGSDGPAGLLADVGAVVARIERLRLGSRGRSVVLDAMTFGGYNRPFRPTRTRFDWLSRDDEQVDAYIADPLCGFVATTQLFIDIIDGLRELKRPQVMGRIPDELPVHVFTGAEDPVGGATGTERLVQVLEEAGVRQVTARVYVGGRHEMLNETNRDEVYDDLVAWIDGVVADANAAATQAPIASRSHR